MAPSPLAAGQPHRFGTALVSEGTVFAPGRVNLIGEHIDYHNLPVLPMALQRGIRVAFRSRLDRQVRAVSAAAPERPVLFSFEEIRSTLLVPGDWGNYVKAAALVAHENFHLTYGIDATVTSDLPVAAGLSSSSALLVAFTLALLVANGIVPSLSELMKVLPEGEQFVGTRGGGMDQAAILASRRGSATYLTFQPFEALPVAVPKGWRFLVADSRQAAEKSAALLNEYNRRRKAGSDALGALGLASYSEAGEDMVNKLDDPEERRTFRHVVSESSRVSRAVEALQSYNLEAFGFLLNASHASLRDDLLVSTPSIDEMVGAAVEAGAAGARITGAGFGGCMVAVCHENRVETVRDTLNRRYYADMASAERDRHLFEAEPFSGALEILNV